MLTCDPTRRAPPLRFDRSSRVMHRRVASARCSATRTLLEPSRPGRALGPSLQHLARRRSWGSALRRFAPASGGRSFLTCRAHVPVTSASSAPTVFVEVAHRSGENRDLKKRLVGDNVDLASGLRSRLRSVSARVLQGPIVPALGFASCRAAGAALSAFEQARSRSNHRLRTPLFGVLSAHGFGRPFPVKPCFDVLPPNSRLDEA
jgi:hypothetical protein